MKMGISIKSIKDLIFMRKTVWSISGVGVRALRGAFDSTRGFSKGKPIVYRLFFQK